MTNLITFSGRSRLQQEYDFLWEDERPRIVREVSDAAAEGDRSENASYIYGRKRLREIDSRLKYLGSRLKAVKVAVTPLNPVRVCFGCWVALEDEDGIERSYQLVGSDEFDVSAGMISIDSPMAVALIGKQINDETIVRRPAGDLHVTIIGISSHPPEKLINSDSD